MLTLFDYLRQRAFESILLGAQEALEVLERQGNFEGRPPSIVSPPSPSGQPASEPQPDGQDHHDANDTSPSELVASDSAEEKLPPPRLRRARRKGGRKR